MRGSERAMHARSRFHRLALACAVLAAAPALAQPDAAGERLREQLRQSVTQLRALQDENTELKVQLERAKQAVPATPAADPAELERMRTALDEQARTLEQRDAALAQYKQSLEQWKQAREQAVAVARERDAEAKRLEGLYSQTRAGLQTCEAGNRTLVEISNELLGRWRDKGPIDAMRDREPLLGFKRLELERLAQDYHARIIDATVEPAAAPAQGASTDTGGGTPR
jgi:DNA repair exonuclease SbcCD ATPase subunit